MLLSIIRIAIDLISSKGVEAFSLREVARLAGVSPGAPYRHFKERDALLAALAEEGFRKLTAKQLEVMPDNREEVELDVLNALGRVYVTFASSSSVSHANQGKDLLHQIG